MKLYFFSKFLQAFKNAFFLPSMLDSFYFSNLFLKLAKALYRAGLIQNFWIIILLPYSFTVEILSFSPWFYCGNLQFTN